MGVVSVLTRPLILYPTPPGEVKILKQKLEDTLAEVQRLRSETTPPPTGHSPFTPPRRLATPLASKNPVAQGAKFKSQPCPLCHTAMGWPLPALLPSDLVGEEWRFLGAQPPAAGVGLAAA